jgi:hypothetical protein
MRQCSPMAVIHPDGSTSSLEVDFALALLSGIESAKKDPAQLRHIVYELARVWLEGEVRKQGHDGSPSVNFCETPRLMLAFEAAIGHVERFSREQEKLPYPPADLRSLHGPDCLAGAAVYEFRQSPQAYQARKSNEAHVPPPGLVEPIVKGPHSEVANRGLRAALLLEAWSSALLSSGGRKDEAESKGEKPCQIHPRYSAFHAAAC